MTFRITFFYVSLGLVSAAGVRVHAEERTWRYIQEVSIQKRKTIDLRIPFLQNHTTSSLPTEHFPLVPPSSAEEMGLRAMEFAHTPLWNCLLIDIGVTVTADGLLDQQVGMSAILSLSQHRFPGQLAERQPGQELFRWISHSVNKQYPEDTTIIQVGYRTGKNFDVALETFFPRPGLSPLRSALRQGDRLPTGVGTIDDVVGRNARDFSWRTLGSDILDRTIRFPTTRKQLVVPDNQGKPIAIPTHTVKMMGEHYPGYTVNGAIPCYVVEAIPRNETGTNSYLSKLIYWLDQRSFFPLRIEQYDQTGKLTFVIVRTASHANPALKDQGYTVFLELSWDLQRDIMTSSIHTVIPKGWSEEERRLFFHPESVQWRWPFPTLAQFPRLKSAEEFPLRPDLYVDKFSRDRKIDLSSELTTRINAQEREGHLESVRKLPLD